MPARNVARNPVSWAPTVSHMNNLTFVAVEVT